MTKERRKLPRWPISSILDVLDRDTGQLVGHLRNITAEGMMLISRKSYVPDTTLRCEVLLPRAVKGGRRIAFDAKSLWCKASIVPGSFQVGFQLLNAVPEDIEIIRVSTQESLSKD